MGRNGTELWALTASANQVDATTRAGIAKEIEEWVARGNVGVPLATCHRVELYGLGTPPGLGKLQLRSGDDSVAHLLRVAAGLESAIVGEDEVLHQVRDALRCARRNRELDFRLLRLFETAIATGRRARAGRTESSGNLAQGAVAWLRTKADLGGRMVIVAGAGRMGAALTRSLAGTDAEITVASRDPSRASRLARLYAGRGVGLLAGAHLAAEAAGVAVALAGPWTELASISPGVLPPVADISAPQAVPDGVRRKLNGTFLGIDDLYQRTEALPRAYIKDAEQLVARKAAEYTSWLARVGGR